MSRPFHHAPTLRKIHETFQCFLLLHKLSREIHSTPTDRWRRCEVCLLGLEMTIYVLSQKWQRILFPHLYLHHHGFHCKVCMLENHFWFSVYAAQSFDAFHVCFP